jgi:hypothetical protein
MSDNYLRLIPDDPRFTPPRRAARAALQLLKQAVRSDRVEAEYYATPVFIDQGTNLEAIICPLCARRHPLHDAPAAKATGKWWSSMSARLDRTNPADLRTRTPCCNRLVEFSRLTFDWPAGVASFELSLLNPNRGDLRPALLDRIRAMLGCAIRMVWARY